MENPLLPQEVLDGLKDIEPTTEDLEEFDFISYQHYDSKWV